MNGLATRLPDTFVVAFRTRKREREREKEERVRDGETESEFASYRSESAWRRIYIPYRAREETCLFALRRGYTRGTYVQRGEEPGSERAAAVDAFLRRRERKSRSSSPSDRAALIDLLRIGSGPVVVLSLGVPVPVVVSASHATRISRRTIFYTFAWLRM